MHTQKRFDYLNLYFIWRLSRSIYRDSDDDDDDDVAEHTNGRTGLRVTRGHIQYES